MNTAIDSVREAMKRVCPEIALSLADGASEEQFVEVEKQLGVMLLDDFKSMYRVHNGQFPATRDRVAALFGGDIFLPLQNPFPSVVDCWKLQFQKYHGEEFSISKPGGYIKRLLCNQNWIPFADGGDGEYIGIDLDPGPLGAAGQVIAFGRETNYVLSSSLNEFLTWFASMLDSGRYEVKDLGFGKVVSVGSADEPFIRVAHRCFRERSEKTSS